MIERRQRSRVLDQVLGTFYRRGIAPTRAQLLSAAADVMRGKRYGTPQFTLTSQHAASPEFLVDPRLIQDNFAAMREDLWTAWEDIQDLAADYSVSSESQHAETEQLRQRLLALSESLDEALAQAGAGAKVSLYDTFRDTSLVDASRTTAIVDSRLGQVTPPITPATTLRVPPAGIRLVGEIYPTGGGATGGAFLDAFSDRTDRIWSASLPAGPPQTAYQATVNLTGGSVQLGHDNEVELNRIELEPTGPVTVGIEWSNDSRNWFPLVNERITGARAWTFEPQWCLFLRFTLAAPDVGIRTISLGKTGWSAAAILVSQPLVSPSPIHTVELETQEQTPYGTTLLHSVSTLGPDGPWQRVQPGIVHLTDTQTEIEQIATLTPDTPTDPGTLYYHTLSPPSGAAPTPWTGDLWRGVSQMRAAGFWYDWSRVGDPSHTPDLGDWTTPLGPMQSLYLGPVSGGTDADGIPSGVAGTLESPLIQWADGGQEWWGLALQKGATPLTVDGWNYRLSTSLYSDRDVLIDDAAGGIYHIVSGGAGIQPGPGWSLYVNGLRVASDTSIYGVTTTPGSGAVDPLHGKSFALPLRAGWNRIELLFAQPTRAAVPYAATGDTVLLLRPNLWSFNPAATVSFNAAPPIAEYPLWADGVALGRTTEFGLRWNTPPFDRDHWAWRVVSGAVTALLLNYDPAAVSTKTLDGKFTGSTPTLRLSYPFSVDPATQIWFRADFGRETFATQPPRLISYRLTAVD